MTPNDEVKTIHASLNDGSLRKWEFEPYTENGKIKLTDQDYATIQSIKGNTVKFNQLCKITGSATYLGVNVTYSDNNLITLNGTASSAIDSIGLLHYTSSAFKELNANHKYIYFIDKTNSLQLKVYASPDGTWTGSTVLVNAESMSNKTHWMFTIPSDKPWLNIYAYASTGTVFNNVSFRFNLVDLTAIFGSGNEPSSVSDFETWLSNNIGLLPYYDYTLGSLISFNGTGLKTENASQTESNTLSLPISTYFPTGMKSAGSVYDEISDKAYTRVGSVDLGTLTWFGGSWNGHYRYNANVTNIKTPQGNYDDGLMCLSLTPSSYPIMGGTQQNNVIARNNGKVYVATSDYTSASDFKSAMSGQYLFYELDTPTSQDISLDLTYPVYNNGTEQILPINGSTPTTSPMVATIEYPDRTEDVNFLYKQTTFDSAIPQFSLVCKNQELPMTLNDGKLICECDSSITNESGFFDAKVKMQDLDSVAYSQKIQLHVERGIND